jgi:hypothetical protein
MNFIQLVFEPIWRVIVLSVTVALTTAGAAVGFKVSTPAPPTATPTPTEAATPAITPTSTPYVAPVQVLIDCIGPDGKLLRITKKACDDFNSAWKPTVTPIPQNQNTSSNTSGSNGGSKPCDVQGAICSPSSSTNYGTQQTEFTFP